MITLPGTMKNRLVYAVFIASAFLWACKDRQGDSQAKPYANQLGIKPSRLAQIDTVHFTTIEWVEPNRSFGTVKEGDSLQFDYHFKNTGRHPLFISGVKPSCGCTVVKYPEEAVMPGREGVMKVRFNTYNQPGEVHKTITVTTNTSNGVKHTLTLSGKIQQAKTNK